MAMIKLIESFAPAT
jgi:hypothetical protein